MSRADERVYIIGIGDDGLAGLTRAARERLEQADVIVGAENTLRLIGDLPGERVVTGNDLEQAVGSIEQARRRGRVVVLAEGDPLFYGMARWLCDRLGKESFEVLPHVSSMQLAFARVKESWEDAYLTNLATRPLEAVVDRIRTAEKVGLFTGEQNSPARIARELLSAGIDYFDVYVCENLGSPDERVTRAGLGEIAQLDFAPLNVMILVRKPDAPDRPRGTTRLQVFGNPDDVFLQSMPKRGLLTPAEVRALALAQLDVRPESVVWDIGAGSGAVAIEAAQLAREGRVFAVERDPEDHRLIRANAERFGTGNLWAVLGSAPEALESLPDPDAVFVGGTGREIGRILGPAGERLRPGGRLVVHVGGVENLVAAREALAAVGEMEVWMIQISRAAEQLERLRFEPSSPTFLLRVVKAESGRGSLHIES